MPPQLKPPMAALGVPDTVRVPGVDSTVEENMSEVVPSRSVEEVLMGSDVVITELAVVSARLVVDTTGPVLGGGALGGEVLPVSSDVLDSSGVEDSVSGLEERRVAVVLESVVGSSVELSMGVEEVGRGGDTVAVTPMTVVSAKNWDNEMHKGWW